MKKIFKIIVIFLVILIVVGLIFFIVDYSRVKDQTTPIFCILLDTLRDGGTEIYLGLGYKAIDYHKLDGYDKTHIGTWFMKYDDSLKANSVEIDDNVINMINNYIINEYEDTKYSQNYENYKAFAITEILGAYSTENETIEVYARIFVESYYQENEKVLLYAGEIAPYKFTIINNDIIKAETFPANIYNKDIADRLFPKTILNKISEIDNNENNQQLEDKLIEQVKQYYDVSEIAKYDI